MPLARARISSSPSPGARSAERRISPRPGAASQKARASIPIPGLEDALEEHILAETDAAHFRAQALPRQGDLGQGEAGAPRAEDDGRHGQLQPVETARAQEMRDRDPAALDEQPMQSPGREGLANRHWSDHAVMARQAQHLDEAEPRPGGPIG